MDQRTDPEPINVTQDAPDRAGPEARADIHQEPRAQSPVRRALRRLACIVALAAGVALLASMAAVPSIAPYHVRIRGVFLTLAPLTAGYALGMACPVTGRRRVRLVLVGAALVILAALAPRLKYDLSPTLLYPTLAGGVITAVVFVRFGLLQAGVSWGGRQADELTIPRWLATFAYAFAWAWLAAAVLNPRETFAPTRWLLTAAGARPAAARLAPAQVHFRRQTVSGRAPDPERGGAVAGPYLFTVGPTTARPGEVMVSVSARRRDGKSFGSPMWLTIDADDPARPDPMNDLEHYDAASVDGGTQQAQALRRSASAHRFTQFAWFSVSQSLPSVRLRARIWTLERELETGDLIFQPAAETDLGVWDLTLLAHLRPQPVR